MAVFERQLEDRFVAELESGLRSDHPEAVADLSDAVVRDRIERALAQARARGVGAGAALHVFVVMALVFGPRFDRHPVVARLLDDASRSVDDRVDALVLELSDRVWDELAILAEAWDDEGGEESR